MIEKEIEITTSSIKELRSQSSAGIMECRKALLEAQGDIEKALQVLKEQSLFKAEKKTKRTTSEGSVDAYIHPGGRIGAMIELNCESDFVTRTDEFKELIHCLAMQIAAMSPKFISEEEIPEGDDVDPHTACLLLQPYIKDPDRNVQDIIVENIAKVGENIKVSRFARFELGTQ